MSVTAPAPLSVPSWPPLVTGGRKHGWITVRDVVVTLIAWGLLGFLLRDPLYVAYDYLRHPIFQLTTAEPLDVGILWWRLRYFWMISAGLIAWLSLWAAIDRRRLRASLSYPQPPPLTIGEQAARGGLEEESVREARTFKVTNVRFNEDESIAGFEHVIRTRAADAMSDAAPSQPNA